MKSDSPLIDLGEWPPLEWEQWKETAETLQLYTQIVGKTRLALTPRQNHWWNVPLYVSARGLSTSAMPIAGGHLLDVEFDFIAHELIFRTSQGATEKLPLSAKPVATFYQEYKDILSRLHVELELNPHPVELSHATRFDEDLQHSAYDPDAVQRFWGCLRIADRLLKHFSTEFYGKISPVHFFWGSFDLAATRFNGRRAPSREGADPIQSEAYSHEVISAGFWPGNGGYNRAAFYAYAAPVPANLADGRVTLPARFDKSMGEFLLDYEDVRQSPDPSHTVLRFFEETYAVAADAAGWDRKALDRND